MSAVSEEEAKVAEIKESVSEKQKKCDEDLAKAEPAVRQAEAALNTLNKVYRNTEIHYSAHINAYNINNDNFSI